MPNKKKPLKSLDEDSWEDDDYVNTAKVLKSGNTEGISIRTKKKSFWKENSSFWIHKDQEVDKILNWFNQTVKRFFSSFWGKDIITEEDIEKKETAIQDLKKRVSELENEKESLKDKYQAQEKELTLAYEVIGNIENYKVALDEFENNVINSVKEDKRIEEWVKTHLKDHRWILGIDCEVKAKNKDIDIQTQVDMHVETSFGEDRVIEVKSPNLNIFKKTTNQRLELSSDIVTALSEVVEYLRRTETYSKIKQMGTHKIDKPIGRILAGYNLDDDQKEFINNLNFYLSPVIKIVTYKDLISNGKKELSIISKARERKMKKPS